MPFFDMEAAMKQGDRFQLVVEKYLQKDHTKEYGECAGTVWRYDAKEACIYFLLEKQALSSVSLDIIYRCEIHSADEILTCTGRVIERYYHEKGKILKFEIENGFYKINLNCIDK